MGWRNRPTYIDYCPSEVDYIMFIDENGNSDLKYIKRCIRKGQAIDKNSIYFTTTGAIMDKEHLNGVKNKITAIKRSHWEDGCYKYKNSFVKKVCLHSREIRRGEDPFSDNLIDRDVFLQDLYDFLQNVPCEIISSTINKERHVNRYCDPVQPYNLCLNFVLERFVKFYLGKNETGIIVLEARGKYEDRKILNHIKNLIDNGTNVVDAVFFSKIKGVYFNGKWQPSSNYQKTYFGLEIVDLYSYHIHRYCKTGQKDDIFKMLEPKIYGYPNYDGWGIKIFPK